MSSPSSLPVRKKLIEVSIPLEAINAASVKEKSIRHGHPSTLHLWWARRPLAACRAVLFAQLVDDPSAWPDRFPTEEARDAERKRLHKVIEAMVPWEASNDETILNTARWEIARSVAWGLGEEPPPRDDAAAIFDYLQTKAPPVYDPFSGGASIPLEAQRLGLRAYGSDLNPVAVLIGKALVEIPPKFAGHAPVNPDARTDRRLVGKTWKGAHGLAEDVRWYGRWIRDEAEKRIGYLYPKATLSDGSKATVVAWLWARTVRSPDPAAKGAMVPLVSSWLLSSKNEKKVWVEPVIDPLAEDGYRFEVRTGGLSKADEERLKTGTKTGRGQFTCILTGTAIPNEHITREAERGALLARMMAVVAEGNRKRVYLPPAPDQEQAADVQRPDYPEIAVELAPDTRALTPVRYKLDRFDKLFTSRQLIALASFSDLVNEVRAKVVADAQEAGMSDAEHPLHSGGTGSGAYADAIATYLAFAVDKAADRNTSLCSWETKMDRMRNTFGRQALPMIWDYAETNPFSGAGGDIAGTAHAVFEALSAINSVGIGGISNINASKNSFPVRPIVISTDPPYYDNIGYADLSDFFYVWLRRSLSKVWPDLFRRLTTPKEEELVATPYRHAGKVNAEQFFMTGMSDALIAMRKAATDSEPLAIYYAFKQSELVADGITSAGWASFLQAIVDAGLVVDGTWPMRTELGSRMRGHESNALASSIVLVCRKRPENAPVATRGDFLRELRRELPLAMRDIIAARVGPVDFEQAVIGPGMGVFSRYSRVLEEDDSPMSVKTVLALINRVRLEVDTETGNFDPETQVALAWFQAHGYTEKSSGEAILLANAKGVSVEALFASGVFHDGHGKVRLVKREDLPANWSPARDRTYTIWESVQYTARALDQGGSTAAAALIKAMGHSAEDALSLSYRLYDIANARGDFIEARFYAELAAEWSDLETLAANLPDYVLPNSTPIQPSLFG